MVASLGAGITQADEQFVGTQNEGSGMNRPLVCHKSAADNTENRPKNLTVSEKFVFRAPLKIQSSPKCKARKKF